MTTAADFARVVQAIVDDAYANAVAFDAAREKLPFRLHARVLAIAEKPLIEAVLVHTGYNQSHAAAILGINRNTLRKRITRHGIATEPVYRQPGPFGARPSFEQEVRP